MIVELFKIKVMKATVSFNGKKYIYKVDGKQIRTSAKSYAYEYVAILTINGEFGDVMAMGNAKTCNAQVASHEITKVVIKSELAYLKGEITYKQYLHNVGFTHAFIKSAFAEMIERKGVEKCIEEREKRLAATMSEKIEVIKIENE